MKYYYIWYLVRYFVYARHKGMYSVISQSSEIAINSVKGMSRVDFLLFCVSYSLWKLVYTNTATVQCIMTLTMELLTTNPRYISCGLLFVVTSCCGMRQSFTLMTRHCNIHISGCVRWASLGWPWSTPAYSKSFDVIPGAHPGRPPVARGAWRHHERASRFDHSISSCQGLTWMSTAGSTQGN